MKLQNARLNEQLAIIQEEDRTDLARGVHRPSRSVSGSVTPDAPVSATVVLAEVAEELVRTVLYLRVDGGFSLRIAECLMTALANILHSAPNAL
jgi:hypothetical protein